MINSFKKLIILISLVIILLSSNNIFIDSFKIPVNQKNVKSSGDSSYQIGAGIYDITGKYNL